jgi:hypothetical protein
MAFPRALDPIRSLQVSWRLLFASFGPLFVGGVILTLLGSSPGIGIDWEEHRDLGERVGVAIACGGCCGVVWLLVTSWIAIGFAHGVADTMQRGATRFESLFDARGRYGDMLLASFLLVVLHAAILLPFLGIVLGAHLFTNELDVPEAVVVLAAIAAALVWLPVVLYVLLGVTFVQQAVALEGHGAIEAFKRSWELARGHRLALFVFCLTIVVFKLLGLVCTCLCLGIGVLLTGTLQQIAVNEAFVTWTRGGELPNWWIGGGGVWSAPPAATTGAVPPPPPPPPPAPSNPIA